MSWGLTLSYVPTDVATSCMTAQKAHTLNLQHPYILAAIPHSLGHKDSHSEVYIFGGDCRSAVKI